MFDPILEYLKNLIPLRQTKKKSVWISNTCPFTGYVSKRRPFRYNQRIGVVKCYCCGCSAKELSILKMQIENPIDYNIIRIKHDPFISNSEHREEIIKIRIQEIKDKANIKHDAIVKSELDGDYPF